MSTSNWPIAQLDSIYWVFYWSFQDIRVCIRCGKVNSTTAKLFLWIISAHAHFEVIWFPSFVFIFLRKIMSTSNWPIAQLDSIYWVFYWFTQIRTQLNMFVMVLILKTYISYLVYTMCIWNSLHHVNIYTKIK
jgi:hypothetical protein